MKPAGMIFLELLEYRQWRQIGLDFPLFIINSFLDLAILNRLAGKMMVHLWFAILTSLISLLRAPPTQKNSKWVRNGIYKNPYKRFKKTRFRTSLNLPTLKIQIERLPSPIWITRMIIRMIHSKILTQTVKRNLKGGLDHFCKSHPNTSVQDINN